MVNEQHPEAHKDVRRNSPLSIVVGVVGAIATIVLGPLLLLKACGESGQEPTLICSLDRLDDVLYALASQAGVEIKDVELQRIASEVTRMRAGDSQRFLLEQVRVDRGEEIDLWLRFVVKEGGAAFMLWVNCAESRDTQDLIVNRLRNAVADGG